MWSVGWALSPYATCPYGNSTSVTCLFPPPCSEEETRLVQPVPTRDPSCLPSRACHIPPFVPFWAAPSPRRSWLRTFHSFPKSGFSTLFFFVSRFPRFFFCFPAPIIMICSGKLVVILPTMAPLPRPLHGTMLSPPRVPTFFLKFYFLTCTQVSQWGIGRCGFASTFSPHLALSFRDCQIRT